MGLPPGAVEVEPLQLQATLLDRQSRLGALLGEPRLDLGLVLGAGLHREQQMMRCLAHIDPPRTGPCAGEDGVDAAADSELAGDLGDPAREPLRFRARLPQVVDVGVVDVLDARRAPGLVDGTHRPDDLHCRTFFPRAISVCRASSRFCQSARYSPSHSSTSTSASGRRL